MLAANCHPCSDLFNSTKESRHADWQKIIPEIEQITFKIATLSGHGTGFIVKARDGTMAIATAWHVVADLATAPDKHKRYVKLSLASGSSTIEAFTVGVARLDL